MLVSQQKIIPKIGDLFSIFSKQNETVVRKYIPKKNLFWVGSGREALRQILSQLSVKKVGISAYTCHVVLDSVKRAGKKPIFYDSSVIANVDDIKKIIKKVDVLVLSYNFGFLPEIDKIAELCKKNKVILIEDCAQALGATYKGKLVGSFGDHAFYSFGISKNVGFCGGLIATDKKIKISKSNEFPIQKLVGVALKVIISPLFFNKYLYSLTSRLLSKELHKKQDDLNYKCPELVKRIILNQFKRYNQISKRRRINGECCLRELKTSINYVKPLNYSNPSWLYFTILIDNKDKLKRNLLKENVELGEMLTFKCLDGKSKKALETEKEVLTFSLYRPFKEMKFIVSKIKKVYK